MSPVTMPETSPRDIPESADWEAFYKGYRKPGYIAGYEILHKLGGGVFGIVYKARKQSIGKAYAIKFLKVDDHGVRSQVLAEMDMVKLFACVDHPNLVSIEDMGSIDGIPYITMGFAGEETLKSRLEEGTLAEEEALRLFVQIARGVQALHEHSLSHFDLKPANIFLKGDIARVGDYGLSKLVTESCMSLTFGRGTPYYMAPEIMSRKGDQRSDIYSLGVILFECLCGEVPFQGETEWEVIEGHRKKPLECPKHLSRQYRRILERMMAKDPADRYPTIAHMLQDLRRKDRLGESLVLEYGTGDLAAAAPGPADAARPAAAPGQAPLPPRPGRDDARDRAPDPIAALSGASDTVRDVLRVDLPELQRRHRVHRGSGRRVMAGLLVAAGLFAFLMAGVYTSLSVGETRRTSFAANETSDPARPVPDAPTQVGTTVDISEGNGRIGRASVLANKQRQKTLILAQHIVDKLRALNIRSKRVTPQFLEANLALLSEEDQTTLREMTGLDHGIMRDTIIPAVESLMGR
mgnify:CR=1 FL=1